MEVIAFLLACAGALGWLARKLNVPYPIALVIGGGALGFLPFGPRIELDPDLVLVIILPPILYVAALQTSWRDFKRNIRPITLLAVPLVIATTTAVAWVIKSLVPDMPWAVAFALGAIVSPPDAVAATAVLQRMRIPGRIVTILEGESLVNDATGLVLYKFAVAAVLTGAFSLPDATVQFFIVAIGGVVLGLIFGRLFVAIHTWLKDTLIEVMLSLLLPYVAYLGAEILHFSGVLAVVAAGLVRARYAPEIFSAESRIQVQAFWNTFVFLLNCVAFILIGLQLDGIVAGIRSVPKEQLGWLALAACVTAVAIRFLWVFPAAYLPRLFSTALRARDPAPPWKAITVISWCGMRGIVSLAAALALPLALPDGTPFPNRNLVIFLAFAVIFFTLVVQGLTLGPLIKLLRQGTDWSPVQEEHLAREALARAALQEIEVFSRDERVSPEIQDPLRAEYELRLKCADPRQAAFSYADNIDLRLRLSAIAAQRRELIRLWREEAIGAETLQSLQRELDLEESWLKD
ncbi:MAG: Na+/H+ antiporter [Burkholderiales bacterium]